MPTLAPQDQVTPAECERGLRLLVIEAAFSGGAAAFTTGVILTGSALHLGASNAMIGILATLVGIALFVILSLDFPFTGSVANGPDALVREINEFCSYDFVHPLRSARCDAR